MSEWSDPENSVERASMIERLEVQNGSLQL